MRTVSSSVATAIGRKARQLYVKALLYNMRTYSGTLSSSYPYDSGIAENYDALPPYPSDVYYYVTADKIFTVLVDMATTYTGAIKSVLRAIKEGSSTSYTLTLTGSNAPLYSVSKPSISSGGYVFHIAPDGQVYRNTVSWSTLNGGSGQCVSTSTLIGALPDGAVAGAIHAVSDSVAIALYPHYGGIGVTRFYIHNDGWTQGDWDNAFMFPTKLITATEYKNAMYSGAASAGGLETSDVFVYITDPETGAIQAVKWDASTSSYSQTWVALQADLSIFRVVNAVYANGLYMIVGQFLRDDEYLKHPPVAMVLTSADGKYLTINQYSLLSKLGWRFGVRISGTLLIGSDLNRVIRCTLGGALGGTTYTTIVSDNTTKDIVSFDADTAAGGAGGQLSIRAAGHEYEDDTRVIKYARCIIYVGYMIDNTTLEWTQYGKYIVAAVNPNYADGKRSFVLILQHESMWLLGTQTPPFYTEIIGKGGTYDELRDNECLGKLYPAPGAYTVTDDHFAVDFWNAEEWQGTNPVSSILTAGTSAVNILDRGGVNELIIDNTQVANHYKCFQSADLKDKIGSTDYPLVNAVPIKVRLYGWNEIMPATSTYAGVQVIPYVWVERNGVEIGLSCTLVSSYSNWTRTYYSGFTPTGSQPIEYTIGTGAADADTALQVGDKIKRIGIMIGRNYSISGVTLNTCCIERAEFVEDAGGELVVNYEENAASSWEVIDEADASRDGLKLPAYGRFVMFSTKPSFAFDAAISAQFSISEGDSPSSVGTTAFGLVLLAEDAKNCIIGRLSWQDKNWEIVMVRDGEETILQNTIDPDLPTDRLLTINMRFEHIGAKFTIYKNSNPILSHTWLPINGQIATGSADILHVGIYGEKTTASFRCTSYDARYSDGIGVMPGESLTDFAAGFPDPAAGEYGKVMIDGIVYKYGDRPSIDPDLTRVIGPYQARSVVQSGGFYDENGQRFYPGVYLHMRYFRWTNSPSIYDGCLLASDIGYNWVLDHPSTTNVSAWAMLSDDNTIQRRSQHTSPGLTPYISNFSNRIYITAGLRNVVPVTTAVNSHMLGARCYLYGSEEIICHWFSAYNANNEFTIKEMIQMISDTSGATATFSGDYTPDDISLTALNPVQLYPPEA